MNQILIPFIRGFNSRIHGLRARTAGRGRLGRTPPRERAARSPGGQSSKTTNTRLADDRLGVTRSDGKKVSGAGADIRHRPPLRPPTLDARLGSSGGCLGVMVTGETERVEEPAVAKSPRSSRTVDAR